MVFCKVKVLIRFLYFIHFDLVNYRSIIDELNGYLRENEGIYDTVEKRSAEHELFRIPEDTREFYDSQ